MNKYNKSKLLPTQNFKQNTTVLNNNIENISEFLLKIIALALFTYLCYIIIMYIYDNYYKNTTYTYNNPLSPWVPSGKRCKNGCLYTGKKNNTNGYECPGGNMCFNNNCCKYDKECTSC